MTHQEQSSVFEDLLQVLSDHGFEGVAELDEREYSILHRNIRGHRVDHRAWDSNYDSDFSRRLWKVIGG